MARKKRVTINHDDIVRYFVKDTDVSAIQIAVHFGISKRAAEKHLKKIRQAVE